MYGVEKLTLVEIKNILNEYGHSPSGSKKILIERLIKNAFEKNAKFWRGENTKDEKIDREDIIMANPFAAKYLPTLNQKIITLNTQDGTPIFFEESYDPTIYEIQRVWIEFIAYKKLATKIFETLQNNKNIGCVVYYYDDEILKLNKLVKDHKLIRSNIPVTIDYSIVKNKITRKLIAYTYKENAPRLGTDARYPFNVDNNNIAYVMMYTKNWIQTDGFVLPAGKVSSMRLPANYFTLEPQKKLTNYFFTTLMDIINSD